MKRVLLTALIIATTSSVANAAEICGNGVDDDADGLMDDGCAPSAVTGVCESPLSCSETGMISPSTGALRYELPPDISPRVPYGPSIGLRRIYTSQYAPGASAPAWKKPLGDRWQHSYMTWLVRSGSTVALHTPQGNDVKFTRTSFDSIFEQFGMAQTGYHFRSLRYTVSTNSYLLVMLDGEQMVYDGAGRLVTIAEPTGLSVSLTYDVNSQVSTVTDAQGRHRLLFTYTGSQLTSVQYQILSSVFGWLTQHTTTYGYTSGALTSVSNSAGLVEANVYTSSYLTQIQDGGGKSIASFTYSSTSPGTVVRSDTVSGTLGFELASSRAACSGKTIVYFNKGNATSCNVDSDCGTGFLCGGKTGSGTTGQCFRGARCLTLSSPSEDVVTTVTPLGPPGESCEGACAKVAQYVWNTGTGVLDLKAIQNGAGSYVTKEYNSNGMPTKITYGDPDSDPTNGNSAREVYITYDVTFPSRIKEIRRRSDLHPSASTCSPLQPDACQVTTYAWNLNGTLASVTEYGTTLTSSGTTNQYSNTTTYSYETSSPYRLTTIDGPLAGTSDRTTFNYWSGTGDLFKDGFVSSITRSVNLSSSLTTSALQYDFWGNPTTLQGPDSGGGVSGSLTCLSFDGAFGTLFVRREAMAGQSDCSSSNSADLTTTYVRDTAKRLTQLIRPDGSCMFYEYDSRGRLQRTKRRDDCNASSSGDRQEYLYDAEGLVTEIQTYDASGTLTASQAFGYLDSRDLHKIINPVDTSKWEGITYDARGFVTQIDAPGSLGKTVLHRDGAAGADGRVTSVDRYKDGTLFDTWNLLYDWIGNQEKVTDGDAKATETVRDDLGRIVKIISPDMKYPTLRIYDAGSRVTTVVEKFGSATPMMHTFAYDSLGRQLWANYAGNCPDDAGKGAAYDETQRTYDSLPFGMSCPSGMICSRTGGKLAYVRTTLACNPAYHATDGALDQETFYGYDDAGRLIREYIRDDSGRVATHQFQWTKNGELEISTMPSGVTIGATYGSPASNSDTDLISALWRTNIAVPIINAVQWYPYGPVKQYNQQNQIAGSLQRTRLERNLAYRISSVNVEPQAGGTATFKVDIGEDAMGRVIKRDYTGAAIGVQDSYFLYDNQDRVICETDTLVSTCPTSGSGLKNNHSAGFTNAGDWKTLLRPIPGSTGFTNQFSLATGTHQISTVTQSSGTPAYGVTDYFYDERGNRYRDNNSSASVLLHDTRDYTYDARGNVINVHGQYYTGSAWHDYDVVSMYDARNRRVSKQFIDASTLVMSQWFFYYDAKDRLDEIRYTPDTASPSTFTTYQLFWLEDRLVLYWQTDAPSNTTTKRYVGADETGRPLDMWTWPASGDGVRVWAINPSAWGFDTNVVGPDVFQPILFAGQYQDVETAATHDPAGSPVHRPGLAITSSRVFDPFTGAYLQLDRSMTGGYVYGDSNPVRVNVLRNRYQLPADVGRFEPATLAIGGISPVDNDPATTRVTYFITGFFVPVGRRCSGLDTNALVDLLPTDSIVYTRPTMPTARVAATTMSARFDCMPISTYMAVKVKCVANCGELTPTCSVVTAGDGQYPGVPPSIQGYVFADGELGTATALHSREVHSDGGYTCACPGPCPVGGTGQEDDDPNHNHMAFSP